MTLRRLGIPVIEQLASAIDNTDNLKLIIKHLQRHNDYLALMTNEPDPPEETEEIL